MTAAARRQMSQGIIEIDLGSGHRIRVDGDIDGDALRRVLDALARRIPVPIGARVWLGTGYSDMRRGFPLLALQVQEVLHKAPLKGHLFVLRGRRSDLVKVIWHDGQGASSGHQLTISPARLSYLLSAIDWRNPQETQHPTGGE